MSTVACSSDQDPTLNFRSNCYSGNKQRLKCEIVRKWQSQPSPSFSILEMCVINLKPRFDSFFVSPNASRQRQRWGLFRIKQGCFNRAQPRNRRRF